MVSEKLPDRRVGKQLPDVIGDFDYTQGLLFFVMENIGTAPAYDVAVSFDQRISGLGGEKGLNEMEIFKSLKFLPVGKKIRVLVDTFDSYVARQQPLVVRITVTFKGKNGKKLSNAIRHDLSIYKGFTELRRQDWGEDRKS